MKNTNLILTFLLLCISNTSIFAVTKTDSNENNIFKTKLYKVGIYKTYNEFLSNNPSVFANLKVSSRTGTTISSNGGGYYTLDFISNDTIFNNKNFPLNKIVKESWGYCDGRNIYVFDNTIYKSRGRNLSKISLLDNLTLIEHYDIEYARNNSSQAVLLGGITGGLIGAAIVSGIQSRKFDRADSTKYASLFKPNFTYILDNTTNGKIVLFNYQSVVEILYYKDSELYEQFMKEAVKERLGLLPFYVLLFNQRNPIK